MDMVYPELVRKKEFTNVPITLEREFSLFVISPDEAAIKKQHTVWAKNRDPFASGVTYGLGFLLAISWWRAVRFLMTRPWNVQA